jgi:hypothetical protein
MSEVKNEGLERFKESLAVYGFCLQEGGNVFKAVANSLMPRLAGNKFQQKMAEIQRRAQRQQASEAGCPTNPFPNTRGVDSASI